ncbi:MAG: glycosyltransferase family 2 protein [Bacteroidales bacterium]|nr:glycosyltransferase family 2 protein [Bacteroidales bacterium]
MKNKIAVLITCHNRKHKTILCIQSLYNTGFNFDVYLVDDGSTDGTSEELQRLFPYIRIIKGNGELFWSRGMSLAWQYASNIDYDYYIWLNDDTILYDYSLSELLNCYNKNTIIQGVLETRDKKEIIYAGKDKNWHQLIPCGTMKEVTYINGNVLLISKEVYKAVGNIDPKYWHDLGDYDYGLRAIKLKIKIYTTTIPIGYSEKNNINRLRLNNSNVFKRFKRLYSPLGAYPSIYFYFNMKHFGCKKAILYYIYLHLINFMPDFIYNIFFKK